MEDKLLDPTLIGVIIGSFLALIGNFLTQYFSIKKEERQWERQRASTREEREEKSKLQEIAYLRDLSHKCVLSLSVYISSLRDNDGKEDVKSNSNEINEIHNWLSLLLLRHPHKKLSQLIDSFLFNPTDFDAERIRKYILDLVENEEALFVSNPIKTINGTSVENEKKQRTITFSICEDFRRQQFVSGIELPQSHLYPYELGKLSADQRERLLKIYFESNKRIPDNVQLYLPVCVPSARVINYSGKHWVAQVNPYTSNVDELLSLWSIDFDKYLGEAEKVLAQNLKTNA